MDFRILWIDDSPDWVKSIQGTIEEHIKDHGFTPNVILQEDDAKIDEYVFRPDIDMIIVDYNLNEKSGDQIIKYLRKKGNFLEIIFYSQDGTVLLDKLSAHTEHVHCAARDDVEDKIKELIDFSKYKCANLGYMRGSVIAEAIDIENILEQIIVAFYGNTFRKSVLEKLGPLYDFAKKGMGVQSLLKESCSGLEKKSGKTSDENNRLKALKECRDIMKKFGDDVVDKRNILAHAQKEWGTDGKLHLSSVNKTQNVIDVSREWMMEMRSVLAKYRGVLNQISEENLLLESEEEMKATL